VLTLIESVFLPSALTHVARNRGFFEKAGVEVVSRTIPSSTAQRAELAEGVADVAVTATDNLFAWNTAAAGASDALDAAVFAQIDRTADMFLAVRPGRESLLDGGPVRLAVDAPTNGFAIAAYAMLEHLGLPRDGYEVVVVGGVVARFEELMAGRVDVTLLGPPLDEVGARRGMTVVARIADIAQDYPGMGIVADRSRLAEIPDAVSAYLTGLEQARSWLGTADEQAVRDELATATLGLAAVPSILASLPDSREPSASGLDVLVGLRVDLDLLIPGAPEPRQLLELGPLRRAGLLPSV
jgi:ABC-type nitrate/sulfonate/bicarbonate transport system substrate-binding protein